MKLLAPLRSVMLALAVLLSTMAFAREARAGSLRIRDDAHVLTPDDVAGLQSVVAAAPFDARLVVSDGYPDAQEFSRYVGSLVTEPNAVAVGLDPPHHHVQVHFGTGSRVPRSEWPSIERAGNDAFRRGEWGPGVAAIFRSASRAFASAPVGEGQPLEQARPSLFSPGIVLLVVAAIIGVGVYLARRRSAVGVVGNDGYGGARYGGPGLPMAPPGAGGLGPLGGGLIGAGLGGLAGYELGKLEGEREGHERGGAWESDGPGTGPDASYDAGGGGSSWDDDAGGGGDFDGGGSDGSGGGSDF